MRLGAMMLCVMAAGAIAGSCASAAGAASGLLSQLPGSSGCLSDATPVGECAQLASPGAAWYPGAWQAIAASPDGKNVYLGSRNGIVITARDPAGGALVEPVGTAGCVNANAGGGCTKIRGLGESFDGQLAVSPDGDSVYLATGRALLAFERDPSSGALTQLAGAAGCINRDGSEGCTKSAGEAGFDPQWVRVAPDSGSLYAGPAENEAGSALFVLSRDHNSGAIAQLPGSAGCIDSSGSIGGETCSQIPELVNASDIAITPDGGHAYVVSPDLSGIVAFSRNTASGALTVLAGAARCVVDGDEAEEAEACTTARALRGALHASISPDGRNLYVDAADGVAAFAIEAGSGALNQLAGSAGCITASGSDGESKAGACVQGTGSGDLEQTKGIAAGPDGAELYVATELNSVIVTLDRDAASGALSDGGCIGADEDTATCAPAQASAGVDSLTATADGLNVYAATSQGAVAFARAQPAAVQTIAAGPPAQLITPLPGRFPTGALPAAAPPSSHLTLVGGPTLLLNARRHRASVALQCAAKSGGSCAISGTLRARIGHRTAVLGKLSVSIPGERITVASIHLGALPGTLRSHALAGTMLLHSIVAGLAPTSTIEPITLKPQQLVKPPLVTTDATSDIEPASLAGGGAPAHATVAGFVDPEGRATMYHFEYGPAPGFYDHSAPASERSAGSDALEHLVSIQLNSLMGGLTYHYRLVAENAGGTSYGADRKFSVPLHNPGYEGLPLGNGTVAGPAMLTPRGLTCYSTDAFIVTGSVIHCLYTLFNPQPIVIQHALVNIGVEPQVAVLDVVAPPGTIDATTYADNEASPYILQPQESAAGSASFTVEHTTLLLEPQIIAPLGFAGGGVFPRQVASAQPKESIACSAKAPIAPGSLVTCTVTSDNRGGDAADFSTFELQPSASLTSATTTAGHPPAVLPGLAALTGGNLEQSQSTTVTFRVSPRTRAGVTLTVGLLAIGESETSRTPFAIATTSAPLKVTRGATGRP